MTAEAPAEIACAAAAIEVAVIALRLAEAAADREGRRDAGDALFAVRGVFEGFLGDVRGLIDLWEGP